RADAFRRRGSGRRRGGGVKQPPRGLVYPPPHEVPERSEREASTRAARAQIPRAGAGRRALRN
ncbi:MAG: hypothetical protein RMJ85_16095, partial [Anaerolineales bacterium]|nr:hypothetical protein [Anaerolineales bacterium]